MSQIRRQSIISTLIIFTGFIIGLVNNLLFAQKQWFSLEEYSLTRNLFDFGQVIFAGSFWGMNAVLYKFFPYYESHTTKRERPAGLGHRHSAYRIPDFYGCRFSVSGFFLPKIW
jgi:hypothetical protein